MTEHLINAYARLPITIERGDGAWLFDTDGNRYLDAAAGIGVCGLGHAHPKITAAISEQSGQLVLCGNLTHVPRQEQLAQRLAEITGLDRAFFANSGAEAIECALKLTRLYGHSKGIDNPEVVVAERSFHGRTLACLSASDSRKVQAGFEPLVKGFVRVPYDDIEAIEAVGRNNPNVAAVLMEPIQGEGGVVIPADDYLKRLRGICDANGWLLILDEIQTGLCRTGEWYAYHHSGVLPDVLCTAKALGNGFPVSACLAREAIGALIQPGKHGSTFGGNPLACRVALTVLETMESLKLAQHVSEVSDHLMTRLQASIGSHPAVTQIRGKGLMIGIDLDRDAMPVRSAALANGVLVNVTRDTVVRLLPPLIIDIAQADLIVDAVAAALDTVAGPGMVRSA